MPNQLKNVYKPTNKYRTAGGKYQEEIFFESIGYNEIKNSFFHENIFDNKGRFGVL